jgi:nucleotide-binding universal stress UspA family protein
MKRLERLKKKVVSTGMNLPVSAGLGRTPILNNILGFAEDNQIDLIVMGIQGGSGLKKTIVGSVAFRVIENSDLPVLLIPEKFELKGARKICLCHRF